MDRNESGDSGLARQVEPEEVGLDSGRLARIDHHLSRCVDEGRLPGWLILVARHGRIAHLSAYGGLDMDGALPVRTDTLWRFYSMTKPVTSVAAMMLVEEGVVDLLDPVAAMLPAFADARVWRGGALSAPTPVTSAAAQPIRLWHLLTHTAGLTYGLHAAHPVAHPIDALYRDAGFAPPWAPPGMDLAGACDVWAQLPLVFEPGSQWRYSYATDVLARVVEVVSGRPFDAFLRSRIFEPLGMRDTGFWVEPERAGRLATLYQADPAGGRPSISAIDARARQRPAFLAGGAGLIGSAADYHRFASMLLGRGQLDGVRLLAPRTVDYMTRNHLLDTATLETFGQAEFAQPPFSGVGFGLGVAVTLDPVAAKLLGSAGEYGWGGAASTTFWVDPSENMTVLFLTQVLGSGIHGIRNQLKGLVSQAITE